MTLGKGTLLVVCLLLSWTAQGTAAPPSDNAPETPPNEQKATPSSGSELQTLEEGLPAKYAELAQLHRKWVLAKGRVPTAAEIKTFQEKLAKGKATAADNPYINKNALNSVGRSRAAYFKKLAEIKADEARIAQLRQELAP